MLASHRLVTIAGIGGAGKTRLAVELTEGLAKSVSGRLFFIPLAAIDSADLAPMAVSQALKLGEAGGQDLPTALEAELENSPTLLVLDNCEHLLPDLAAWVAELLAGSASLRILATSRERLGIPGEAMVLLGPLTDAEAVELLEARASASSPAFRRSPGARDELLALCRCVDNLPLGVELAARRLASFTTVALTRRIRESVEALGEQRGVPERHRSLETAIEWSYRLLSNRAQSAWRALSVYPGSFSFSSARAVIGPAASRLLDDLVSRSIVTYSPESGGRYSMLQAVRQFGYSRLTDEERAASEGALVKEMLSFAIAAEAALGRQREDLTWLSKLDVEQGNLRRALSLAVATGGDAALRLSVALAQYWDIRGQLHEAAHWTAAAIVVNPASGGPYAQVLDVAGWIAIRLGNYEQARDVLTRAVAAANDDADIAVRARALSNLGLVAMMTGDFAEARQLLEQSLAEARQAKDAPVELGPLFMRALLNYFEGDAATALVDARASVDSARAHGNRKTLALFLGGLGNLMLEANDRTAARDHLTEALLICVEIDDQVNLVLILGAWCRLLVAERQYAKAIQLADALERVRSRAKVAQIPIWQARIEDAVSFARAALGSRPVKPRTQAAPEVVDPSSIAQLLGVSTTVGDQQPPSATASPLSGRERQVAELVAAGLGNQEIARQLFIGARTVETHVEHILEKLSLPNRLAIARWLD